jgi:LCP family protein required for cell wall assembly
MAGRHFSAPVRPHRSWLQRAVLFFGVLATVLCLSASAFVLYVYAKVGELVRFSEQEVSVDEAPPSEPQNFLIVGSDSRENVDPNDPDFADVQPGDVGGNRTDTIILARVDPDNAQVQMVSFPRDLAIPIADTGNRARINTAYGRGRQVLIDTIAENFGIDINHYVEVDFTGFQRLVSAVEGVPIYLDTAYRDPHAGLAPIGPGCVTLDGPTALEFARSRQLQFRDSDGDWRSDPTGDLGRISRQQLFIRKALERVLDLNPFTNPGTLVHLLDVAVDSVKVDAGLSTDDLRNLAERFRSFDPSTIENHSLTVENERGPGGAAWLHLVDDANTQATINSFRGLPPGAVTPGQVTVLVQNGSGVQRQAADTAEALTAVGFETEVAGDATEPAVTTTVFYAPGSEESARLVARHLTSQAVYDVDPDLDAGVVRLVTGPDFTTVIRTPWPEDAVAGPTTTTTQPTPGSETTSSTEPATTTTSSTVVGVIPEEPPAGTEC